MTGVPLRIYRDGQFETVYAWVGRSGEAGAEIAAHRAACRDLERTYAGALKNIALVSREVRDDMDGDELAILSDKQQALVEQADEIKARQTETCVKLLRACLIVNYGRDETDRIVDALTDAQLRAIPHIIETGDEPSDFFPWLAIRRNASDTPRSADGAAASASSADSRQAESTSAETAN